VSARWAPRVCAQACVLVLLLCASLARADVQRYTLVVGNEIGAPGEGQLRYAESDARKLLGVPGGPCSAWASASELQFAPRFPAIVR